MKMINVKSSNIDAIGYENNVGIPETPNKNGVLRLQFTHGASYDYLNVPREVYEEMMKSESKGSFFHRKIRNNYTAKKVE